MNYGRSIALLAFLYVVGFAIGLGAIAAWLIP